MTETTEKQRRIYYQDIVYSVCSILDDIEGQHISAGSGIVCGTVNHPSTEVQDRVKGLQDKIKRLRKQLADTENDALNMDAAHQDELSEVESWAKDEGFEAGKRGSWM